MEVFVRTFPKPRTDGAEALTAATHLWSRQMGQRMGPAVLPLKLPVYRAGLATRSCLRLFTVP